MTFALWISTAMFVGRVSAEPYHFHGQVIDGQSGKPLAATVLIRSAEGTSVPLEGDHSQVHYLGNLRTYVDGEFSLHTKAEKIDIEIRRGLETLPLLAQIDLTKTGSQTFKLQRWINLLEKGTMSGDSHVHFVPPETAHLQMRAEDLNVVNVLTSDFTNDEDLFTGDLAEASTPAHSIWVGQELRDWDQGHVCLLRLRSLVDPLKPYGGMDQPNLLLSPRMHQAHLQHGSVVWAHFSNLPGSESPVAIILSLVDAIELVSYNDPTVLPSHRRPWESSGMLQAEFPIMCGVDLYYQYLNAGFRVPIVAGTDKMNDQIPVGSNRVYCQIEGPPSYDAWTEAMQSGQGFITNGPILTFSAAGKQSGSRIDLVAPGKIKVKAAARSILPFKRLELLVNGQVVHRREMGRNAVPEAGLYSLSAEASVELDQSSWIAARVTDHPDARKPILPRGLTVFAHTNPVYVYLNDQPVRLEASVGYLQKYLEATKHWLEEGARFGSNEELQQALDLVAKAQDVLQSDLR